MPDSWNSRPSLLQPRRLKTRDTALAHQSINDSLKSLGDFVEKQLAYDIFPVADQSAPAAAASSSKKNVATAAPQAPDDSSLPDDEGDAPPTRASLDPPSDFYFLGSQPVRESPKSSSSKGIALPLTAPSPGGFKGSQSSDSSASSPLAKLAVTTTVPAVSASKQKRQLSPSLGDETPNKALNTGTAKPKVVPRSASPADLSRKPVTQRPPSRSKLLPPAETAIALAALQQASLPNTRASPTRTTIAKAKAVAAKDDTDDDPDGAQQQPTEDAEMEDEEPLAQQAKAKRQRESQGEIDTRPLRSGGVWKKFHTSVLLSMPAPVLPPVLPLSSASCPQHLSSDSCPPLSVL